jgi:hypothetical protein
MDKIPFSIYDFFGYLSSGFLMLVAVDYAFNGGWLLRKDMEIVYAGLWVVVAYITGHIIANISGYLIENRLVRHVLRSPEETLFEDRKPKGLSRLFPGFSIPLPAATQRRVLEKAERKAGTVLSGRGLFFHCFAVVKRDEACLARLNTFLNLYGFCRNISLASVMVMILLAVGFVLDWKTGHEMHSGKLWWAGAALVASIGMLYRYLKFFRHYTVEVFITYGETE